MNEQRLGSQIGRLNCYLVRKTGLVGVGTVTSCQSRGYGDAGEGHEMNAGRFYNEL